MGRPKKNTNNTEIQTKAKTIKASDVTACAGKPKDINALANVYIGEEPNSQSDKEAWDNIQKALKKIEPKEHGAIEQNKQLSLDTILKKYQEMCIIESDINELLPHIYEIAKQCETCTEMGVRKPTSTWAFLAAKPKMLTSYDIGRYDEEVSEVEQMCKSVGQGFKFIQANVLEIEIEETDFLFIDTFHTFTQLTKELQLHANKAKKFLGFHDTVTFGQVGQEWMPGTADFMNCGRGILPAIENFLNDNPEWIKYQEFDFNNGMIILKRN